jgi:nucleoside phosphorylase
MRRILPVALAILVLSGLPMAAAHAGGTSCHARLLVLSAVPGEIDGLITNADLRPDETAHVDGHTFFVGTLEKNEVVLALTGVGLVNATETARTAFNHFRCGSGTAFTGMVFSGTSGGKSYIGDVGVPSRWTGDDGKTWVHTDPRMLATARKVARSGSVQLSSDVPAGDPACVGVDPSLVPTMHLERAPRIYVGGDGKSADPFGGRRFPCFPGGGDVFGCEPCRAPSHETPDVQRFATGIVPFIDPDFFFSYFQAPPPADTSYRAEDMETAAAARVAADNGVPFIAFRAQSDGKGDPLMLPGFPFQFFYYRQLAADNAAATTRAFLLAWAARH